MTKNKTYIRYGPVLLGLLLVAILAVMNSFNAASVMAAPPSEKDFFGVVVSVEGDTLLVSTEEGIVDVMTSDSTMIRLPLKSDASLEDLVEGDVVAVSLDDDLVAAKVFVIPGKTQFRHVPGEVTFASEDQITIQPLSEGANPLTFNIGAETQIRLRAGATELVEGVFAVVLVKRDPLTGELSRDALEIHIAAGKPHVDAGQGDVSVQTEPENVARVMGVFNGIDGGGNWIVGDTFVVVDADTEIESGIAVGQPVEVHGELLPSGSLHAREIEASEEVRQTSRRARLEGIFQGVNEDGSWIVSGTIVIVGEDTDTDGLPFVGQRVKVEGLVQDDGSIIAREIENRVGLREDVLGVPQIKLEGIFKGVDEDGNWIVNGIKVAVGENTRLEGTPAVGNHVEIKAIIDGDRILALEIEGEERDEDGISQSRNRVEFRGIVERIDEGTLVVGRHRIAIHELTEIEGEIVPGATVKVAAFLLKNGQLVAKEIELEEEDGDDATDLANRVSIEGTVEQVIQRDTIVVNGITVVISPDLQIEMPFVVGARIKVEGVLQEDGSVLARRFRVEDRGHEVEISGLLETVVREEGGIVAVIINGRRVEIGDFTEIEGALTSEMPVKIKGILSDGSFVAREVEVDNSGPGSLDQEDEETVRYRGVISAFGDGTLELGGETVFIINRSTRVDGQPLPGAEATVEATMTSEGLTAVRVEVKEPEEEEFEGVVARLNDRELELRDGTIFSINQDTRIDGALSVGARVEIEAMVLHDNLLIAVEIDVEVEEEDRSSLALVETTEVEVESRSYEGKVEGRLFNELILEDGTVFLITRATEIRGRLFQGAEVEVDALVSPDGTLTAVKIEAEERDDMSSSSDSSGSGMSGY